MARFKRHLSEYKKYNADIKENPSFSRRYWRRKDFLLIFEFCNLNFDYKKALPMNEQKQIKNLDYKKRNSKPLFLRLHVRVDSLHIIEFFKLFNHFIYGFPLFGSNILEVVWNIGKLCSRNFKAFRL